MWQCFSKCYSVRTLRRRYRYFNFAKELVSRLVHETQCGFEHRLAHLPPTISNVEHIRWLLGSQWIVPSVSLFLPLVLSKVDYTFSYRLMALFSISLLWAIFFSTCLLILQCIIETSMYPLSL